MKARLGLLAVLAAVVLTWSPHADAAGDANGFGQKHQLIFTADRLVPVLSFTRVSVDSNPNPNTTQTQSTSGSNFSLLWGSNFYLENNIHSLPRVAVDFTVIEHLTIGGAIAIAFGVGGTVTTETETGGTRRTVERDAPRATVFGIAPRVGYIIPLGDSLALWPRGGFAFYSVRFKQEFDQNNNTISQSRGDSVFSLDLDPQLAIVPFEHFYFSLGPLVNIPITGTRKTETTTNSQTTSVSNDMSIFQFGITASLGGFFNL
jgi:hypothetical protein